MQSGIGASSSPERCRPLQSEGYAGHGEVTVLSDGAEIMKSCRRRFRSG
jgi:hypothetical protein